MQFPVSISVKAACLTFACLILASCATRPPKKIRLPPALAEASGLVIAGNQFWWHNDSGDGPFVYRTGPTGAVARKDSVSRRAVDFEDMCHDDRGNLYVGDFGNNTGRRPSLTIYRYDTVRQESDTIHFTYPDQDGSGIHQPGNYNCEAMVYADDYLHLFTKDVLFGDRRWMTYHYRIPARPGRYEAELVDSLRIPRRVVTAAALDRERGELVLTAYTFKRALGFLPSGSASLITIRDFPGGRFLRGKLRRRNLSWTWPTQFEAIDFYDDRWLYVASEANRVRKHALARRKRRR
ncbi:hypothetical protein [Lewinella sp. W8]|uniref:hypothetical protein n=1 Tax=Lewinella sp. W8 TaxID=2528208 RepID=UPI0010681091|nr:hypothetical protein [Lewinella sp. W8]MTB52369.1 hypothetical protein [Lewinella sp. W8]